MAAVMQQSDLNEAARALAYFNSDDRDEWVQMGCALKNGYGDDGRALWMRWSATSPKFNEKDAANAWRSFKPTGGITVASLFGLAKQRGYRREKPWEPPPQRPQRNLEAERRAEAERQQAADKAAKQAEWMLGQAEYKEHPYLESKHAERRGLVLGDELLIPMRHITTGQVRAVQAIRPDGGKKFKPFGCSSSDCIFTIGPRGRVAFWVEGVATGYAVRDALDHRYRRRDRVICCFSSGQLGKLPQRFRRLRSYVVADHDWWHCRNKHRWHYRSETCPECGVRSTEPAGEKAARATGMPWWQPPMPGTDAHDYLMEHGIEALCKALEAMYGERERGRVA